MLKWFARFLLRTALITCGILFGIWLVSLGLGDTASMDWLRIAGVTLGIVVLVTPVFSVFWSSDRPRDDGSKKHIRDGSPDSTDGPD